MHFHLPKPLHGWREFAGEVGIIVVGVLIALGAEQVVELVHQRNEAAEANDIIRGELAFNLGRLQSRSQIRSCIDARLLEIERLLDRATAQSKLEQPIWIGRPQYWTLQTSRWEAESQAGHAALIDRRELAQYGFIYALMRDTENEMMLEQSDWAKLRMLERVHSLDEPTLADLNAAVQDASYRAWRVALISNEISTGANELKLAGTLNSSPATRSVCYPMNTTRDAANRISKLPFGEP
jgi:hypothetical protein